MLINKKAGLILGLLLNPKSQSRNSINEHFPVEVSLGLVRESLIGIN
jgi:hypothetical protein